MSGAITHDVIANSIHVLDNPDARPRKISLDEVAEYNYRAEFSTMLW
jgi:hypothetical protein